MLYEIVKPKNAINLVAGLVGIAYDRVLGSLPEPPEEAEDLTLIDGIGPAFARRLNEGGVYTFEQLARMTPEEIRSKARMQPWQGQPEAWIVKAQELAGRE